MKTIAIANQKRKVMGKRYGVILAVFTLTLFSYAEGWGADWKVYSSTDYGIRSYDAESMIRPSKGVVRVWTKLLYNEKAITDTVKEKGDMYKTLSYTMVFDEFICAEKEKRLLALIDYSTDGKILFSANYKESKWSFIVPESVGESLYNAVCK